MEEGKWNDYVDEIIKGNFKSKGNAFIKAEPLKGRPVLNSSLE